MNRILSCVRPAILTLALALLALAASPSRSEAQYVGGFGYGGNGYPGGGYGYPGYGYGGYGNGGYGLGGYGYGGYGYGYPGIGLPLYDPFYINSGLNPTTLATGMTPLAIQSAIADRNLIGAARMAPSSAPARPIYLVPGTYRLVIER